jgi:prevent-host-death family protein
MERIGIRELRQHASVYIDRVRAGETVEVTDRGELVALLVPPAPAASARDRMIRDGLLIPAEHEFRWPEPAPAPPGAPDTLTILNELREDIV